MLLRPSGLSMAWAVSQRSRPPGALPYRCKLGAAEWLGLRLGTQRDLVDARAAQQLARLGVGLGVHARRIERLHQLRALGVVRVRVRVRVRLRVRVRVRVRFRVRVRVRVGSPRAVPRPRPRAPG